MTRDSSRCTSTLKRAKSSRTRHFSKAISRSTSSPEFPPAPWREVSSLAPGTARRNDGKFKFDANDKLQELARNRTVAVSRVRASFSRAFERMYAVPRRVHLFL